MAGYSCGCCSSPPERSNLYSKRVFLRTFGCQMNTRDSEVVSGLLQKSGHKICHDPAKADIIILNTCSVRQHAEDKVWSEIGRFKNGKLIGVIGCMAQNYGQGVFERSPNVSFVVGPADIEKIPGIIARLSKDKAIFERKIFETEGECRPEEIYHTGFYQDKNHAYVVISEGCSNFCSYCVVPYVRGGLHNRNHKDILKEIQAALKKGITRFTLLGQNVNAYKYDKVDFIKLLGRVDAIKGLKEFSFITSHPRDTSIDLFKAMNDLGKLKKYLHLPVQSGSDGILKLMNRGYSRKFYLALADNYRKIVKDGALTSDIIVGFPTETEEDFKGTYDLVKAVRFSAAYIFKYSSRPHTEAFKMADTVAKEDKEERHKLILDLQKGISKKNAKKPD
ncbi:MAG: tRNA (N6-isopentenyl adenosine(37)-C2)-methylthiotransferase MiaB [Candidatus Omnitrophica bacterium]|nr:tRNA (N6-isopentenyl adenosine(37)-C2)-methylthiotransferase MiaB [Candidatus Omnitrophota bacterium]